jgi:hypothetical protein
MDDIVEYINHSLKSKVQNYYWTKRDRWEITGLEDVIMKMECIIDQFAAIAASPGK